MLVVYLLVWFVSLKHQKKADVVDCGGVYVGGLLQLEGERRHMHWMLNLVMCLMTGAYGFVHKHCFYCGSG